MTDLSSLLVPNIKSISAYQPGLPLESVVKAPGVVDIIKLNANENPLGASPKALAKLKTGIHDLHVYPNDNALIERLAAKTGVEREGVVLGSGSNDILDLLARLFLKPGVNAVFSEYAFALYPLSIALAGAESREAPALAIDDPVMPLGNDLIAMRSLIDDQTRMVFIANPNNPTGTWLSEAPLVEFLDSLPRTLVVVLDEAYIEYAGRERFVDSISLLSRYPNLVVTRTFSKIYGLAGLRLGYSLSSPELASYLRGLIRPFGAGRLSLLAAEAALDDDVFLQRSRQMNRRGIRRLQKVCAGIGLRYLPSATNFLTIDFGRDAQPIYDSLLSNGFLVRKLDNYGLSHCLRITIGDEAQIEHFIRILPFALEAY